MMKTFSKDRIYNIAIIAALLVSLKALDHFANLFKNNK